MNELTGTDTTWGSPHEQAEGQAVYELHGVTLRSPLPLAAPAARGEPTNIHVERGERRSIPRAVPAGELIADVSWPDGRGYALARHTGGYTLRFFETCEFRFGDDWAAGRLDIDPTACDGIISLLLAGNVLAWYLTLKGEPPLHASARGPTASQAAHRSDGCRPAAAAIRALASRRAAGRNRGPHR